MATHKRPDFREIKIQFFDNVYARSGQQITMGDFINMVKSPNHYIDVLRKETDPDRQKQMKMGLPTFAISATYMVGATSRARDFIDSYTGLICVDCDEKDNPRIPAEQMKDLFKECAQTLYCALSARGNGVFAIMRLMYPRFFKRHFKALQRMIKNTLGLNIDESCSDQTRLRLLSHDDTPYINPNAEPFALLDSNEPTAATGTNQRSTTDTVNTGDTPVDTLRNVQQYINEIQETNTDIAPTRDEWVNVGFALHTLGETGRQYFRIVSDHWRGGTTTDKDIEVFWRSAKGDDRAGAITIATFFDQCHKYGIRPYTPAVYPKDDFADIDTDENTDTKTT